MIACLFHFSLFIEMQIIRKIQSETASLFESRRFENVCQLMRIYMCVYMNMHVFVFMYEYVSVAVHIFTTFLIGYISGLEFFLR